MLFFSSRTAQINNIVVQKENGDFDQPIWPEGQAGLFCMPFNTVREQSGWNGMREKKV